MSAVYISRLLGDRVLVLSTTLSHNAYCGHLGSLLLTIYHNDTIRLNTVDKLRFQ
jgi:hypothetical protein